MGEGRLGAWDLEGLESLLTAQLFIFPQKLRFLGLAVFLAFVSLLL